MSEIFDPYDRDESVTLRTRIEELEAEVEALNERREQDWQHLSELRKNALPSNCTRCHGAGAEPPGSPEDGPCERCGGWTSHKRLIAAVAELEAEVERLKRPEVVLAAFERMARDADVHEAALDEIARAFAKLAEARDA